MHRFLRNATAAAIAAALAGSGCIAATDDEESAPSDATETSEEAVASNLVRNGGFEKGLKFFENNAATWGSLYARSGENGVRLARLSDTPGEAYVFQLIEGGHGSYSASVAVAKVSAGEHAQSHLTLNCWNWNATKVLAQRRTKIGTSPEWHRVDKSITCPHGTVWIGIGVGSSDRSYDIDNLSLVAD